jgi:hypothetical protein
VADHQVADMRLRNSRPLRRLRRGDQHHRGESTTWLRSGHVAVVGGASARTNAGRAVNPLLSQRRCRSHHVGVSSNEVKRPCVDG